MFPVEVFQKTLDKLVEILQSHQIRFHLTGGLTGAAYGEPRMTQDMDVVIDPRQSQDNVDGLVRSFKNSDFMFDEGTLRAVIGWPSVVRNRSAVILVTVSADMFNRDYS